MEIKITIKADTVEEFKLNLETLTRQVVRSARKQGIDPELDFFVPEDADSLSTEKCDVRINRL